VLRSRSRVFDCALFHLELFKGVRGDLRVIDSMKIHKLISKDIQAMRGVCSHCGPVKIKSKHRGKYYACNEAEKKWSQSGHTYIYRKHKKDHCERCKFIPVHPCQLDVDHIDGNHENHKPENLQTLCANCHRLKTHKKIPACFQAGTDKPALIIPPSP
jgi:hypothetical protein